MDIVKYRAEYAARANNFKCGNIILDNFLKDGSALDENQGITYIMLSADSSVIIGYYNIEVGRLDRIEAAGENIYYKPMGGTVSINYLAIHSKYQGTKIAEFEGKKIYLGDYLLRDCEKRILGLRSQVGISFVTICSTQKGYHLYDRNGYENFEEDMSNFVDEGDKTCL